MHELSITENIVAIAQEAAQGRPVKKVTLEIGELTAVMPEAIRFCFDVCSQGTLLAGSELEIREIPGRGACRHCGANFPLEQPYGVCDRCDSYELDIIQGKELSIKEMEVESTCV